VLLSIGMRAALTQQQQGIIPLPDTMQLQLLELQPASGTNPVPRHSNNDQNQPPATTAKSTMTVPRRTLIKRAVSKAHNQRPQLSRKRVLTNGIPQFPVWSRDKKQAQLNCGDGNKS
jgi:hypothetical protein